MLRSNPDYLAISFEAREGEGAEDIVRVERNPADPSLVRVVPESRLRTTKADELMPQVARLEPGDVKLSLAERASHDKGLSTDERLYVATPVYSDTSGECFGMTVIEADISQRILQVLQGVGTVDGELYVGDGQGHLWASANMESGARIAKTGQMIPDLPQEVVALLDKEGEPFDVRETGQYIVQRYYVDPTGRGVIIFARMSADD